MPLRNKFKPAAKRTHPQLYEVITSYLIKDFHSAEQYPAVSWNHLLNKMLVLFNQFVLFVH